MSINKTIEDIAGCPLSVRVTDTDVVAIEIMHGNTTIGFNERACALELDRENAYLLFDAIKELFEGQEPTTLEQAHRINRILQCALIQAIEQLKQASSAQRAKEIEEQGFRFSDELLKQSDGLRIRHDFDEIIISAPAPLNQINKIEESKDVLQEAIVANE